MNRYIIQMVETHIGVQYEIADRETGVVVYHAMEHMNECATA